ncbi:hypothetical protein [Actinocorallia aurantiaca]|uniref:Uncharacterized protein n=1 Tax=Actinocorallia aurantiaca TaxID=46204 RepID=A0ABN3U763_9ACTN
MRLYLRPVFTLSTGLLLVLGLASPAQAAPKASFKLDRYRVSQNSKVKVSWKASGKPKRGSVLLQRTVGTAAKYTTVRTLSGNSGTVTVKAPVRGKYRYRILVRDRGKRTKATAVHTLYSYADVTLSQITGRSTQTVDVGGVLFRYVYSHGSGTDTELRMDSTSCRSGTIFLAKNGDAGNTATASVIQELADLQEFGVESGNVEAHPFTLAGRGAVQIDLTDASDRTRPQGAYLNATFSCYTADGKA